MNLKGKKVILKDGSIGEVLEHDNYVHVLVNDKIMKFNYKHAFENGFLKLADDELQESIIDDLEEIEKREAELSEKFHRKIYKQSIELYKLDTLIDSSYNGKYLDQSDLYHYVDVEKKYDIVTEKYKQIVNVADEHIVLISYVKKTGTITLNRCRVQTFSYYDHFTDDGDYIFNRILMGNINNILREHKAILSAKENNKKIILFVRFAPRQYYAQGVFELVSHKEKSFIDTDGILKTSIEYRLKKVK